jgi:hypothetical protein
VTVAYRFWRAAISGMDNSSPMGRAFGRIRTVVTIAAVMIRVRGLNRDKGPLDSGTPDSDPDSFWGG